MDIVVVTGALNDSYGNNATWIDFGMMYTVINTIISVSYWIILATCFPSS